MPELPEVEVTRLGLLPYLMHARFKRVTVRNRSFRWPVPAHLERQLEGSEVRSVTRRGKYILIECAKQHIKSAANGAAAGASAADGWLILHLGMTGTLVAYAHNQRLPPAAGKHDHVDFVMEGAGGGEAGIATIRFNDPRRFGAVLWHDAKTGPLSAHPLLQTLGVEPFSTDFTPDLLFKATRGRSVAVKQALLAGDIVVGVGNIYASESLFRAGIRPTRAAGRVTRAAYARLHATVRATLQAALDAGGSTLRDFRQADGSSGYFQLNYMVYDRAGEPCTVCATPIRRIVQGQRSTFYCNVCQR
jgi:formamidopyrimidine-DNA glycosylase